VEASSDLQSSRDWDPEVSDGRRGVSCVFTRDGPKFTVCQKDYKQDVTTVLPHGALLPRRMELRVQLRKFVKGGAFRNMSRDVEIKLEESPAFCVYFVYQATTATTGRQRSEHASNFSAGFKTVLRAHKRCLELEAEVGESSWSCVTKCL
jgi:hypothetical protein